MKSGGFNIAKSKKSQNLTLIIVWSIINQVISVFEEIILFFNDCLAQWFPTLHAAIVLGVTHKLRKAILAQY